MNGYSTDKVAKISKVADDAIIMLCSPIFLAALFYVILTFLTK